MKRLRTLLIMLLLATGVACEEPETYRWKFGMSSDGLGFTQEVMPVLLRDCGFPDCHGTSDRFFQIYGPGRSRLDPLTPAFKLQTGAELELSYNMVLSMIDAERPGRSLLLRKPLAREAGGAGHLGVDRYGRDVYRTVNDPGYRTLALWVFTVKPGTPPPEDTMPPAPTMMTPPPAMAGAPAPPP
jgi:hypothetical protein